MKLLIVQPWFTAIGHPAQSVLNTARVLGVRSDVGYLIADPREGEFAGIANELAQYGSVTHFRSRGDSLRVGTLLSLSAVLRAVRENVELQHILYLDADLLSLAAVWPLASRSARHVRLVSSVYLGGPEHIASHALKRALVSRYLSCPGRRLFLRTDELRQAWHSTFSNIPHDHIATIPSLEIVDEAEVPPPPFRNGKELRFGVIGQVRPGKSLEWLVPLFEQNVKMGTLHIAGTFTNRDHQQRLAFLSGYWNFDNRFLTEADMLRAASGQDYLLALYDDWDARMEAATIYLAARAKKPVIVYDKGWPGRMIREFGCGIVAGLNHRPNESFFSRLPRPGEDKYQALVVGVDRFRAAHSAAASREAFLGKILDE